MNRNFQRAVLTAIFANGVGFFAGCGGSSPAQPAGNDSSVPDTGTGADSDVDTADTGGSTDDGGVTDTGLQPVTITLSESAFTMATPDLHHGLTATVTGGATTAVTWSSSNSYIATVSPGGVVTSVSGGQVDHHRHVDGGRRPRPPTAR